MSEAPAPQNSVEAAPVVDPRARAIVRGTVTSAEDEAPIPGASVYVRGGAYQTEADGRGEFSLSLPPGTHQISVIAPGFSTQLISKVEARANVPSVLNVKLQPGSQTLDEMVVVGARVKGGIATLIAERRESKAVADVIGAEQMARSGDSNAAAALSRVTGITVVDGRYVLVRGMGQRYSTLTLNGLQVASPDPARRVVPLDIFPAGVIDSVIVQKTYTSDLPGEFGGGLVQLRSRDYPHEFLFNVNLALGGNVNSLFRDRVDYTGGKYDFLGIDDGSRKQPSEFDDPRGTLGTGFIGEEKYSQEEIDDLGRLLPRDYNTRKRLTPPDLTLGANVGNEWRLRHAKIGFVSGAAYRTEFRNITDMYINDPGGEGEYDVDSYRQQVSLSAFLDWGVVFSADHRLKFTTMYLRQTDDTAQRRDFRAEPLFKKQTYLQWVERQILLQQVSGRHAFFETHKLQIDWRYAFGRAGRYEPNRRYYSYGLEGDEYAFLGGSSQAQHTFSDLLDLTHEGAIDIAQQFPLWRRLQGKAKVGAFVYRRDRSAESRSFEYQIKSSDIERTGSPDGVVTDDRIGLGSIEFGEVTRPTDSYDAKQQIEAGYAAIDLPLAKPFEVSGGARVEHARFDVKTFNPFDPNAPPIEVPLENTDVLPFAALTGRFLDDFQVRGGYSRTVNRPDLRELSPGRYFDLEQNLLLVGNPDVKRALIENFDARFEWYYTPDEVFSIGGFLKRFYDPIEDFLEAGQETVRTVRNIDKAISYGLELEGRKRLGFIHKVLKPMYLASNFSLIGSNVEIPLKDGVHKRPLQGQSPWVINAQIGWDDSEGTGTAASLLFNSAGKRIRFVGDVDQGMGDTWELPIHRMDFVISQKLPHKIQIGGRVRNILNSKETWEEGGVVTRRFRRGADFQLSLSWAY